MVGLLVMVGGAFLSDDSLRLGALFTGFMNVLHFPCGLLFAGLGHWWAGRWLAPTARPWWILLAAVVVFGGIEGLQPFVGRSRGLGDFLNSLAGAAVMTLVIERWQRQHKVQASLLLLLGAVVIILQWGALARTAERVFAREACWPRIENFESAASVLDWAPGQASQVRRLPHPDRWRAVYPDNHFFGELVPATEPPGPLSMVHVPVVNDWRAGGLLCLEARLSGADSSGSDGTPPALILRIDDRRAPPYNDRVTVSIPLNREWQRHCVTLHDLRTPGGRALDLADIQQLVLSLSSSNVMVSRNSKDTSGSMAAQTGGLTTPGPAPVTLALDNLQVVPIGQTNLPDARCKPGLD